MVMNYIIFIYIYIYTQACVTHVHLTGLGKYCCICFEHRRRFVSLYATGNRILTPNFKCSEGRDKKTPPSTYFQRE